MANRSFTQYLIAGEKNHAQLWGKIAIGASGAPTLDGINSKGIKSIVRNSTGNYTVTFGSSNPFQGVDIYKAMLFARKKFIKSSGAPAAPIMYVTASTVSSDGKCTLQFCAAGGTTATDPASGEEMRLEFRMKTSTAPV